jgi:capsular polysaccharide export protein
MRQYDLASTMTLASRAGESDCSKERTASGVLELPMAKREIGALSVLLPEFKIERRLPSNSLRGLSGVATWVDWRHRGWVERRAAAFGVPFLLLGRGILRAPPRWGDAASVLSATAHRMIGRGSTADFLNPGCVLATEGWETPELLARAAAARREIIVRRLGGEWWHSGVERDLPRSDKCGLVIVGERPAAELAALPSPALLCAMLAAAIAENAPHPIVVVAPSSLPMFLKEAASRGCIVLTGAVDLWEAIARAANVYTTGDEAGFLALLAGARLRCFGDCFYSGWGVTVDETGVAQKTVRRTIDEVFAGTCLVATRYLDPYHQKAAALEETLEIVSDWRKQEATNRRIAVCLGMSFWKRRQVSDFLRSGTGGPAFRRTARAALGKARRSPGGAIAVWASRVPAGLAETAQSEGIPLILVEDGFIRSVGLGSDFMPAASLVLDSRGMHFDPSTRSDLEHLLVGAEFDDRLVERAGGLIARLVARGVTKYNVGSNALAIEWPAGKQRILVPGQVEDDLSVRLGGAGVAGNLDLLARVRHANPKAFIVYKPHPDVEAGHRKGRIPDDDARGFADLIVRDVSTAALLAEIDELHTLTSLAGFEALLRGRRVVVYGSPFYAGWGLTVDVAKVERGRRLTLEELVAGALILYPRYLDPVTRLLCTPEIVVERLEEPELWRPGLLVGARRLQGFIARQWSEHSGRRSLARSMRAPGHDDFKTPQL